MGKEQILDDYKKRQTIFDAYQKRLINLLSDLLKKEGLNIHQITGRTKGLDSLIKKIDKKAGKYNELEDITDIVGLRVITYLDNEVDRVAEIIKREFKIDEVNSSDKRLLKIDQFGYRSLHIVISLSSIRGALPEYVEYSSIKCELQIRSILQHAWAEIEHDLGYKGKNAPDEFKRAFNRLAALLESADIEFVNLKTSLSNYEKNVPELIQNEPETVDINKASLASFIETNLIIADAIVIIEKATGFKTQGTLDLEWMSNLLKNLDLQTIKDLDETLQTNKKRYLKFVSELIEHTELKEAISSGVAIMYLAHFLSARTENIEKVKTYLEENNFSHPTKENALKYIELYQKSK